MSIHNWTIRCYGTHKLSSYYTLVLHTAQHKNEPIAEIWMNSRDGFSIDAKVGELTEDNKGIAISWMKCRTVDLGYKNEDRDKSAEEMMLSCVARIAVSVE